MLSFLEIPINSEWLLMHDPNSGNMKVNYAYAATKMKTV